jgi:predicted nucleotidyltransferase
MAGGYDEASPVTGGSAENFTMQVPMPSATQAMDAPLERLVRHVVEVMHPLEIWLFGSRAENRERPTSDHDLLVVMPDGTPELELDPVRAWRLGWEARVTADIIPCTRSEFDEEKDELDSLPRAAMLRGRKIYER